MSGLDLVAGLYSVVGAFLAGMAVGTGERWRSLAWVAWPVVGVVALVWGTHHRRRWWCALVGHRPRAVLLGFTEEGGPRPGHQCRRCWGLFAGDGRVAS